MYSRPEVIAPTIAPVKIGPRLAISAPNGASAAPPEATTTAITMITTMMISTQAIHCFQAGGSCDAASSALLAMSPSRPWRWACRLVCSSVRACVRRPVAPVSVSVQLFCMPPTTCVKTPVAAALLSVICWVKAAR